MRKVLTVLTAAGLVLGGFIARDIVILSGANAAVAGLDDIGLRTDPDFRDAVEWIVERCDVEEFAGRLRIDC